MARPFRIEYGGAVFTEANESAFATPVGRGQVCVGQQSVEKTVGAHAGQLNWTAGQFDDAVEFGLRRLADLGEHYIFARAALVGDLEFGAIAGGDGRAFGQSAKSTADRGGAVIIENQPS